ncbi:hypothetical protein [Candidatus Rariloculus sp.]|uniref:hypothetical protein n=1 Tax=Candidatus Rariloculus sp. TaxID=3101265 RepID=UPI003D133F10
MRIGEPLRARIAELVSVRNLSSFAAASSRAAGRFGYLRHIADEFHAQHWDRIRRYYRTCRPPESHPGACHERQLHLFGEPCPPF